MQMLNEKPFLSEGRQGKTQLGKYLFIALKHLSHYNRNFYLTLAACCGLKLDFECNLVY